jgi:hypothetical protein
LHVLIGNPSAIEGYRDAASDDPHKLRFREAPGDHTTTISIPSGIPLHEAAAGCIDALRHQMKAGERPAWIESNNEVLEAALLEHFGIHRQANRRPRTWGEQIEPVTKGGGGITPLTLPLLVAEVGLLFAVTRLNVRTLGGRDWMARIMGDPNSDATAGYASGSYLGFTEDGTTPADSDTVLSGEIVVGTMQRRQAIYGHTNGTSPYTLTTTVTSDDNVTLRKLGVFIGPPPADLVFEALLNEISVMVPGDQTQITETVTLNTAP